METVLDETTIRERFEWQHRESCMGTRHMGMQELLKHEEERLLADRYLEGLCATDSSGAQRNDDEVAYFALYEYEGIDWSTGEWAQKEFPRAILVLPMAGPRDYGGSHYAFTHLGCAFEVCDHMSYTIFHLEDKTPSSDSSDMPSDLDAWPVRKFDREITRLVPRDTVARRRFHTLYDFFLACSYKDDDTPLDTHKGRRRNLKWTIASLLNRELPLQELFQQLCTMMIAYEAVSVEFMAQYKLVDNTIVRVIHTL